MRVNDIFEEGSIFSYKERKSLSLCTQFLDESKAAPLYKNLQTTYGNFAKIKVRFRKQKQDTPEIFTKTVEQALHTHNLWKRAIFAHGETSFIAEETSEIEPYYIFPINGYKFIYSKEVTNSGAVYQDVLDTLIEHLVEQHDEEQAVGIIKDLVKYAYVNENLSEGITSGAEILLYNIPYYYVVKASVIDYPSLLDSL